MQTLSSLPAWPGFSGHKTGLACPGKGSPPAPRARGYPLPDLRHFETDIQMAVYRCEVKTLKRASGRSAVAAAAYRAGQRLRDEQANEGQGKTHDYRRRAPGVVHSEILTPDAAPDWAQHRRSLWNEAERAETRKNSVTAREIIVSLPHELDDAQHAELVHGFAAQLVARYGVAVDLSVHRPDRKGDERNHHAHVLMTTRRMDRDGFTEKTRELDDMKKRGPEEVEAIRALWECEQNLVLERAGHQERVSRLSNKERGLDREPEPKIGEAANALLRRGQPTRRGEIVLEVRQRNAQRHTMRENMVRQRSEKIERQKQEDIENALKAAAQANESHAVPPASHPSPPMPDSTGEVAQPSPAAAFEQAKRQDKPPSDPAAARQWERERQEEYRQQRDAERANRQTPYRGRKRESP